MTLLSPPFLFPNLLFLLQSQFLWFVIISIPIKHCTLHSFIYIYIKFFFPLFLSLYIFIIRLQKRKIYTNSLYIHNKRNTYIYIYTQRERKKERKGENTESFRYIAIAIVYEDLVKIPVKFVNFSSNVIFVVELRNYAFREFQVMQKNFVCFVVVVFGLESLQDFETQLKVIFIKVWILC